jgi:hypothetical protein
MNQLQLYTIAMDAIIRHDLNAINTRSKREGNTLVSNPISIFHLKIAHNIYKPKQNTCTLILARS